MSQSTESKQSCSSVLCKSSAPHATVSVYKQEAAAQRCLLTGPVYLCERVVCFFECGVAMIKRVSTTSGAADVIVKFRVSSPQIHLVNVTRNINSLLGCAFL